MDESEAKILNPVMYYIKMNYFGEMLRCILFPSDEYHKTIADSSNMTLLINKIAYVKNHMTWPQESQVQSNKSSSIVFNV